MREILFRGKRKDNGKWAYSSRFFIEKRSYIYIPNPSEDMGDRAYLCREVINETIGQYTGLRDKNGEMIFEGDIILYGLIPCVVKYDVENARFMLYEKGKYLKNGFNVDTMKLKEVIGNIHDNPELL